MRLVLDNQLLDLYVLVSKTTNDHPFRRFSLVAVLLLLVLVPVKVEEEGIDRDGDWGRAEA